MSIEQPEDLAGMRRASVVVRDTVAALSAAVCPGVTTLDLDRLAQRIYDRHGARSAPRDHLGFPGTVLISVNDEAVHGIPGSRRLEAGDVIEDADRWTVRTRDGSLSAHVEHTLLITRGAPTVLTA